MVIGIRLHAFMEITTLYHQRSEDAHDAQAKRRQEDDRFAGLIRDQDSKFAGVLNQNKTDFEATGKKISGVTEMAQESLRNITGADSFPYVAPQPAQYPGPVPLVVWDHGKYMLSGVNITMRRQDNHNFYAPSYDLGILHPGWGKNLPEPIQPQPDPTTGEDIYFFHMNTQSDLFIEVLHFRRHKNGTSWATKFWVQETKFGPSSEPKSATPPPPKFKLENNTSVAFTIYDRSRWSDEPLPESNTKPSSQ